LFKEAVNHESLKRLVDNKGKGAHSAIIKIALALLRLLSAALACQDLATGQGTEGDRLRTSHASALLL
jgi:hypothetical protein